MESEITRLKDFTVRLESQVNSNNSRILDLRANSMENNYYVIVNGVEEKAPKEQII